VSSKTRPSKPRISRRGFLRASALGTGAAVSLTGCGSKEEKLIPLLVPEESIIPGTDRWTPSTCTLCPGGCGILVRSMQGEAKVRRDGREYRQMVIQVKKVEGNPSHPINLGKMCARGQALPQLPYHPDRLQTPLKRTGARGTGKYQAISWDEALALLETRIKPLLDAGAASGLAAIAGDASHARHQLLIEFFSAAGSDRIGIEEPPGVPTLRTANWWIYGRPELEVHDLENTRYLLSFGAGLLETHTSPVRYSLGLAHLRGGTGGRKAKFVQVESRLSLTAAQADEWISVRPGAECALALAMAHVILKEGLFDQGSARSRTEGFEDYRDRVLQNYSPEVIAKQADVPAEKIIRVAREFARHQPGIALAGGAALAHSHGLFTAAAVQSLNTLVGNQGSAGGISWTKFCAPDSIKILNGPELPVDKLLATADSIQVLLLWNADPVYGAPASSGRIREMEKIPFIAACTSVLDDTSVYADLILPDQTSLERWDLIQPDLTRGSRLVSVCQPVIKPMYETRDFAEVLLTLAAKIGGKLREALPHETFKDYLKHHLEFADVLNRGSFVSEDIAGYWDKLLEEGVWVDSSGGSEIQKANLFAVFHLEPSAAVETERTEFPLHLQPFASVGFGFGGSAHLPWMQELPDPMTSVAWGSWVEINPRTAAQLNIREGEVVWVESEHGRVQVPALLSPGARPDTVNIPFGQGHRGYGRYAAGRGTNPWEVIAPVQVRDTSDWAWAATRVRIRGTGQTGRLVRIG
jgi:menaquinone reductase, molybdopterin-binding-like subunit